MRNISPRAAIAAVASIGLSFSHDLAWAGDRDPWSGTYFGVTAGSGYGAFLGNNQKLGNFVVGIEGEAKTGSSSQAFILQKSELADVNWALSARARAGVLVMPQLFVYGTIGLGAVDFLAHANAGNWQRDTLAGLQIGAGAEFKLLDQISLRVDYIYTDPKSDIVGTSGHLHLPDPALGVLQFGVTYRF